MAPEDCAFEGHEPMRLSLLIQKVVALLEYDVEKYIGLEGRAGPRLGEEMLFLLQLVIHMLGHPKKAEIEGMLVRGGLIQSLVELVSSNSFRLAGEAGDRLLARIITFFNLYIQVGTEVQHLFYRTLRGRAGQSFFQRLKKYLLNHPELTAKQLFSEEKLMRDIGAINYSFTSSEN
jgi:hypothetical protein